MTWKLSRFRTGDIVEVRSAAEILATLDQHGALDGLPFMPEMLQYCGRRYRIAAVAHKTCDMAGQTWRGRRLQATVHLAGIRCDGSAHDGCQADCNLFWKDEWLKLVGESGYGTVGSAAAMQASSLGFTEAQLRANTHHHIDTEQETSRYSCQATEMYTATRPLAWWDLRQYVFDILTGNHAAGHVLRVLLLASLRWMLAHLPCGYRLFKWFHDYMHQWLSGRASPALHGQIPDGAPTPTARLDLKPGEYVRIKTQAEIEQTLQKNGKNRGLSFDPEEMAPYCGRVVQVRKSVTKIIDESTGKMRHMKHPCIMLEGVICRAEYARYRLNCPRGIPSYWREIWLERVEDGLLSHGDSTSLQGVVAKTESTNCPLPKPRGKGHVWGREAGNPRSNQ